MCSIDLLIFTFKPFTHVQAHEGHQHLQTFRMPVDSRRERRLTNPSPALSNPTQSIVTMWGRLLPGRAAGGVPSATRGRPGCHPAVVQGPEGSVDGPWADLFPLRSFRPCRPFVIKPPEPSKLSESAVIREERVIPPHTGREERQAPSLRRRRVLLQSGLWVQPGLVGDGGAAPTDRHNATKVSTGYRAAEGDRAGCDDR